MAKGDLSRRGEEDLAPDAHVFVGRGRVPVDPGEAKVVLLGRKNLQGERVLPRFVEEVADAELVGAVGARDFGAIGDFFAVKPDIRAVVDAKKMKPGSFARERGRRSEFPAEPE